RPSPLREPHELEPERDRVVAASPLDPRAVLRRDERDERRAVVMGGDWCETAAADGGDGGALGFHAAARLRVVGRGDEMLLARANLQRERSLRGFRQQLVRL